MGHTGPVESAYSTNKNLSENQVENMRTTFAEKVEASLIGNTRGLTREEVQKAVTLQYHWLAINDSPLMKLSAEEVLKDAELRRGKTLTIDDKITTLEAEYRQLRQQEVDLMEAGTDRLVPAIQAQKVISELDLPSHLSLGWNVVLALPSGKIVVQK